jgi:hypothetical protein
VAGEIKAAAERMEARKEAALVDNDALIGEMVGEDTARLIFSGVGLDFDEILELTPGIKMTILGGLFQGLSPDSMGAGLYFDGIVTGLLIAEAREREGAKR